MQAHIKPSNSRFRTGLIAVSILTFSACIMPGQTPLVGSAAEATGACGPEGVIDDGEDNNNQTASVGGRGGYWYTFADDVGTSVTPEAGTKGGTFTMSPGGANQSKFAANARGMIGRGQIVFGALGFNFVDPKAPYDASRYAGISFWARKGPGSYSKVRLKVPDISTNEEGGICRECFNDFGMDITLTEDWRQFVVPFKKMKQLPDWGSPRPRSIDKSKLYGVQWQVNQPGVSFDIWIDDVEFFGCE
jgi:endoglucanase